MNCTLLWVTSEIYIHIYIFKKRADFDRFGGAIPDGADIFKRTSTGLAQPFSAAQTCHISCDFGLFTNGV